MPDLAELNLRIKATEVDSAKRSLDTLTSAGNNAENSQKKLYETSAKLDKSIENLRKEIKVLSTEIGNLSQVQSAAKNSTDALTVSEEKQKNTAASLTSASQTLEKEINSLASANNEASKASEMMANANNMQAAGLQKIDKETAEASEEIKEYADANKLATEETKRLTEASKNQVPQVSGLEKAFAGLKGRVLAIVSGYALIRGALSVGKEIADFETLLVGVGKTTNLAGEELDKLGDAIVNLSLTDARGSTAEKLLEIAESAGQLGVRGSENLLQFVQVLNMLESSTDIVGAEGARGLARLLRITGESASEIGRLGSVISKLGGSSAALESDILNVATAIAQSSSAYNTNTTDAVGLAAAYAELGVQVQIAGSSTGVVLNMIEEATREGGSAMDALTQATGRSREEFSRLLDDSPIDAFAELVRGISEAEQRGESTAKVMKDLGLSGRELQRAIAPLSANYGVLAEKIATARQEGIDQTALITETARASSTFAVALNGLGNTFKAMELSVRNSTGALADLTNFVNTLLQATLGLGDVYENSSRMVKAFAEAIRIATVAVTAFLAVQLAGKMKAISASFLLAAGSAKKFSVALLATPIGLKIAAVAALVAGLFALSKKTVEVGDEVATFGDITVAIFQNVAERIKLNVQFLYVIIRNGLNALGIDFESTGKATFSYLESLGEDILAFFDDGIFGGIIKSAKFVANAVIALVVSSGQTLGVLATRAVTAVQSFTQIRFTDFSTFTKAKEDIVAALSPTNALDEIKTLWVDSFEKNFVGDFGASIKKNVSTLGEFLNSSFKSQLTDPDLKRLFEDFEELGGFSITETVQAIKDSAEARAAARKEAAEIEAESIEESKQIVESAAGIVDDPPPPISDEVFERLAGMREDLMRAREELEFTLMRLQQGATDSQIGRELENARFASQAESLIKEAGFGEGEGLSEEGNRLLQELIKEKNATDDVADSVEELRQLRERAAREAEEQARIQSQLATKLGDAIGGSFGAYAAGVQDSEQALKRLAVQIAIVAAQAAVLRFVEEGAGRDGLISAFNSFGQAFSQSFRNGSGAVVESGNITRFNRGGILSSPTTTTMASGATAQIAEAGRPEAIMPLQRLSNGDLGVQVTGDGGGSTINQRIQQRIIIQTPDAEGFRRSRSQISEELRRPIRRGR